MTVEQIEAAGAKVWLDQDLVVRFAGPDAIKSALRADPAIKVAIREELMVREFCQICRRLKSRSRDLKVYWSDLEALPRKLALGLNPKRAKELATMLLGIVRQDWEVKSGRELEKLVHEVFQIK
jgi:hypothetical protein